MNYKQLFCLQASLPVDKIDQSRLGEIVAELKERKLEFYSGRSIIVDLPPRTEGDGRLVYLIPPKMRYSDLPILIKCAEGMFGPTRKEAVVVCGANVGKQLKPFWRFDHQRVATSPKGCEVHAMFSVPDSVVSIRAYPDQQILVIQHEVLFPPTPRKLDEVGISSVTIFNGSLQNLPPHLGHFSIPARIAVTKATTNPYELFAGE